MRSNYSINIKQPEFENQLIVYTPFNYKVTKELKCAIFSQNDEIVIQNSQSFGMSYTVGIPTLSLGTITIKG